MEKEEENGKFYANIEGKEQKEKDKKMENSCDESNDKKCKSISKVAWQRRNIMANIGKDRGEN